ncbi:hypothetical protein EDC94DRAFT_598138 [Helicostylum pulchrum]|nr:hypothetical protein EDC94DRAFT_598138 [Helicostylum pulchrum]
MSAAIFTNLMILPYTSPCKYLSNLAMKITQDFFINRDEFLFRYILLYLRTGELHIHKQRLKSLRIEAEFYGLPRLVEIINTMISKE